MKKFFYPVYKTLRPVFILFLIIFSVLNADAQEIKNVKFVEPLVTQSGSSYKISFEKDGETLFGILKPVRYINIKDIQSKSGVLNSRQDINSTSYRNSEYAVYLFDKFLGTGFVPETFVYVGENNMGYSIQLWLEDREYGLWDVSDDMEAFDFITGNLDRFYDRNLIKSNGNLYAIDNEVAFPSDMPNTEKFTELWKEWKRRPLESLKLSTEMQKKIEYMDTDALYEVLAPAIKEKEHIGLMISRIKYLRTLMLDTKIREKRIKTSDGKNMLKIIAGYDSPDDDGTLVKAVINELFVQKDVDPRQFVINMVRLKNPNVMVYLGAIAENNKDYEQITEIFALTEMIKKYSYGVSFSKKVKSDKPIGLRDTYKKSILMDNVRRARGLKLK